MGDYYYKFPRKGMPTPLPLLVLTATYSIHLKLSVHPHTALDTSYHTAPSYDR